MLCYNLSRQVVGGTICLLILVMKEEGKQKLCAAIN